MNDLSNVKWTAPKPATTGQHYPQASVNYYPALRPTPPVSARSTASTLLSSTEAPTNPPTRSNPSTPANDSFANLVSFDSSQANKGLSLQEQQRQLQEKIIKQEVEKTKAFDARFGAPQTTPWNIRAYGRTTIDRVTSPPTYTATSEYGGQKLSQVINKPFASIPTVSASSGTRTAQLDEDDILAAFSASAPVDNSSHMPNLSKSSSIDPLNVITGGRTIGAPSPHSKLNGVSGGCTEGPNDDPFGFGTDSYMKPSGARTVTDGAAGEDDDDDVLGLLGRPVSEFPKKPTAEPASSESSKEVESHPQERAVAELVDMGFPPETSRRALETTESGTDVQAAVGWLLNQAHEDSRRMTKSQNREDEPSTVSKPLQSRRAPGRRKSSTSGAAQPVWTREQERVNISQRRPDNNPTVNGEKDPAQYASEIGNKMFKTAGSLWKTSTKKLNQAVQEFNSDSDSSQPKWMRDAQPEAMIRKPRVQQREADARPQPNPAAASSDANVTDEALMLEADSRPLPRKSRAKAEPLHDRPHVQGAQSPTFASKPGEKSLPQPRLMQQAPCRDLKPKLSRQTVEEETSQAYVSPARRRRPTPKPAILGPEPDLLLETSKPSPQPSFFRSNPATQPRQTLATPATSRLLHSKRTVPPLSSFALQASTKERQEGNGAFKRGDYAQATIHYSKSLSTIPSAHPLAIILLTNRALTHSKVGDAKASLADAKSALDFIGSSRGTNETIDLGDGEGNKPMSTYWEKAMTRQAEALEHLERWAEAAAVWRSCVEAGVGGATGTAGRNRSEKAAALPSQPKPSASKKVALKSRPKATALGDLAPDSESVTRLRAANAAADRIDDEKFALADVVDARVSRWRAGKEGNLRALLSTLDNVLWSDSGWKRVGMGDLLLPGKVKVVYMKGIAKVHPDKLPTTATTEQKMISAVLFATLNEAWERFKTDNGLINRLARSGIELVLGMFSDPSLLPAWTQELAPEALLLPTHELPQTSLPVTNGATAANTLVGYQHEEIYATVPELQSPGYWRHERTDSRLLWSINQKGSTHSIYLNRSLFGSSMLSLSVCLGFGCSLLATISALPTDHLASQARIPESYAPSTFDRTSPANDSIEGNLEPFLTVSLNAVSQSVRNRDRRRKAVSEKFKLDERALSLPPPPQPSTSVNAPTETNGGASNITAFVPPDCWPNWPPPRGRHPISRPRDCRDAFYQVLDGGAMAPAYWDSWHTWTSGSCSIRLIPAVVSSRDAFTRLEIARVAARIQTSCVNEAHDFRGGIMGVGLGRMFDISVEAATNSPLHGDRFGGVSIT